VFYLVKKESTALEGDSPSATPATKKELKMSRPNYTYDSDAEDERDEGQLLDFEELSQQK
jgi:hypothetical protein